MFFWRGGGGGVGRELVELSSLNTTSNYVDVSFFFSYRVQHNRAGAGVEQEPAEPTERQEMKH